MHDFQFDDLSVQYSCDKKKNELIMNAWQVTPDQL